MGRNEYFFDHGVLFVLEEGAETVDLIHGASDVFESAVDLIHEFVLGLSRSGSG